MTDRAEQMREAAARIADNLGWPGSMSVDEYDRLTAVEEAQYDRGTLIASRIRAIPLPPAPTPHEYQPSLNPNDQGECVICGGGPHTRIEPNPAPTLAAALALPEVKALVDMLELQNQWVKAALECKDWAWDHQQHDAATWSLNEAEAALRRIAEARHD